MSLVGSAVFRIFLWHHGACHVACPFPIRERPRALTTAMLLCLGFIMVGPFLFSSVVVHNGAEERLCINLLQERSKHDVRWWLFIQSGKNLAPSCNKCSELASLATHL